MRRRLGTAAVLALALVALAPATATPADAPLPRLRVEGRWLVDDLGRVVLLHGVNNVDKEAPYVEPGDGFTLTAQDAALLAGHGFNTVRLGVELDGLMPTAGVVDTAYLDRIAGVVDTLGAAGIYVLLDDHQDGLSKVWGGNGFPPWAITARPLPGEPNPGFPLYYAMPSMNLGWDEVWHDTHGVVGHVGDALAALAGRLAGHPAVLGLELLNEPWPGTASPTCFVVGCPVFDALYQSVLQRLTDRVHAVDPTLPILWEPNTTWNLLSPTHVAEPPLTPAIGSPPVVFSFHDYCEASQAAIYLGSPSQLLVACDLQQGITWSHYDAFAARAPIPALVTEFGDGDPAVLGATVTRADEHLIGWQYWHYASTFGPDPGPDPFTGDIGRQLVRTYPQATAGSPRQLTFDPATGDFHYVYDPLPAGGPTVIYVSDLHDPDGYTVTVTGGHVTSAPGARRVTVEADGATAVTVDIRAGSGSAPTDSRAARDGAAGAAGDNSRSILPATGGPMPAAAALVAAALAIALRLVTRRRRST